MAVLIKLPITWPKEVEDVLESVKFAGLQLPAAKPQCRLGPPAPAAAAPKNAKN